MVLLFFTRLILYFLTLIVPVIHPGIAVPYDTSSWWLWFFLVPAEMGIAFFLRRPRFSRKVQLYTALIFLAVTTLGVTGISVGSLSFLLAGTLSFVLTILVFRGGEVGGIISFVEPLFLGLVYFRLLSFSRSSESVAAESAGISQLVFALIIITYLVHCLVIYFAAFRGGNRKRRRVEAVTLGAVLVPLIILFTMVLPPDFVEHSTVLNNIYPDKEPETLYDTDIAKGWENRRNGVTDPRRGSEGEGDQAETGINGELQGIPADQWGSFTTGSGEGGKQYTVMLVIAPNDPVYAADAYYAQLDPVRGFIPSGERELNMLTSQRFIETWRNPDIPREDEKRFPVDITYLSTLRDRVVAYVPYAVEPTVLKPHIFPFEYFYNTTSGLSFSSFSDWKSIGEVSPGDLEGMERYLEIPLAEEVAGAFEKHLDHAVSGNEGYGEKIEGILRYFSTYQYELGFDDDVSIPKMRRFLDEVRSGDCTEFSNSAAILGRMAGIPSRVVTGYLASRDLQSPAHRRGVRQLKEAIPELAEYRESDIYLVTTAHRHSWVQFYIPRYGWVDVESTAYAIPPPPGFDPNSSDVVIPIIRDSAYEVNNFTFPWQFLLRIFLLGIGGVVIILYVIRYGREVYLKMSTRSYSPKAVKKLYRLLLMKTAAAGLPLKTPSATPAEYAREHPILTGFAEIYTRLRYRERAPLEEKVKLYGYLLDEYRRVVGESRDNALVIRVLSLKGLYY